MEHTSTWRGRLVLISRWIMNSGIWKTVQRVFCVCVCVCSSYRDCVYVFNWFYRPADKWTYDLKQHSKHSMLCILMIFCLDNYGAICLIRCVVRYFVGCDLYTLCTCVNVKHLGESVTNRNTIVSPIGVQVMDFVVEMRRVRRRLSRYIEINVQNVPSI